MSILSTVSEEDVYFNFINSLKSEVTKKTYEREIKKFTFLWLACVLLRIYTALMIFPTMNSILIFVLLSVALLCATIVFSIPNVVQAKISFCASGTNIFQCFIKQNDCEAFTDAHPETTCVRSKS